MKKIKVFAASVGKRFGEAPENFGDNLMQHLLCELYRLDVTYVPHAEAELLGVGSVLDAYFRKNRGRPVKWFRKRHWRTMHVWGAGFMSSTSEAIWPQTLKVFAVRGPLSRSRVGKVTSSVALGDPALLLPKIWPSNGSKTSNVLIVPHFVTRDAFLAQYGERLPKHWSVVDLLSDPCEVTRRISSAEFVVSSSLHGLIVADAYGVPSCWMKPHAPIKGDGFKFKDYAAQRGKPLAGPVDFEEVLDRRVDLNADEFRASPPSEAELSQLIASFPLR